VGGAPFGTYGVGPQRADQDALAFFEWLGFNVRPPRPAHPSIARAAGQP